MTDPEVRAAAVTVVGGGLGGCEAAWQLAEAGFSVRLLEMRPTTTTAAHRTGDLAELVCSNSFRSDNPENAVGLLKREMEVLGSLVMACARAAALPAGDALAVDRTRFAAAVTHRIAAHPRITVERCEVETIPAGPVILATGPLTSAALHRQLESLLGEGSLAFFDAIAPVVAADSLDTSRLYAASRYGKGGGDDYLNAPLEREEYLAFVAALRAADRLPLHAADREVPYFEGCLPIEVMAERGPDTLRFGPMKPVGLPDPRSGRVPYAVVQLRRDDLAASQWNLVGFQTRMTFEAQRRVFRLIPGLENARFVRFGTLHRNTFVCAPRHLDRFLRVRNHPALRLAGQLTGVEGYVESAAIGLLAGLFTACELAGGEAVPVPGWTAHGGLLRHLTERPPHRFQPANVAWGLMADPPLPLPGAKRKRRAAAAAFALAEIQRWRASLPLPPPPRLAAEGQERCEGDAT
ncbi:MAG: methylenetetrahydrofolate--tRNA-(uracil(54)-C(5))-methyltransferase (FADH(2)-oxidizing) TrmFO [Thermoanaerobaculaceae bacterium]|nr:methylenetetrahydrofolate--tRNA-(uracil(54)-C(5))-methyltransferase (FADH(2)-oxidizing) TrmFO [Thermoanaerobaculaceae bacterium]